MSPPTDPTGPSGATDLEAAFAEFRGAIAELQAYRAQVASDPDLRPGRNGQLHEDALAGRLGPEMEQVARRVEAGDTSWGEVFEGDSPYSDLILPHLTAMEQRYAERWRELLEADPSFDPDPDVGPVPPGVPE